MALKNEPETASREFADPCPIELGETNDKTDKQLAGLVKHSRELGNAHVDYYKGNGLFVLALDDVIEIVETSVNRTITFSESEKTYGKPVRIFDRPTDAETRVYNRFALDTKGKIVSGVIYFKK